MLTGFCVCRKKTKNQRIFQQGSNEVMKELNLLRLVQGMQKIRAALSVMMKDNRNRFLEETKAKYLDKQTLWHDSDNDKCIKEKESNDPFDVFMS